MKRKVVGVVMAVGIFLAFISIIIIALNPFKTLPSINVLDAYWTLNRAGYVLHINLSTTAPVQLVGVMVGNEYYDVAYDVTPPTTKLEIQTKNMDSKVVLHFDVGNPKNVHPKNNIPQNSRLLVVYGVKHLFLMGVLNEPATVFVVPVPRETRVLVVVAPNEQYKLTGFLMRTRYQFNGTIVEADKLNMEIMRNSTTIVFMDIMPEPQLLNALLKERKAVVAYVYERSLGELRFDIASNGSVILRRYDPDISDIDYFGVHCVVYNNGELYDAANNVVKNVISLHGPSYYRYVISSSTYCRKNVVESYAETRLSEIVIGKTSYGFYFASTLYPHILTLASMGFFESSSKRITIINMSPFKGIYPLPIKAEEGAHQAVAVTRSWMLRLYAEKPPATYTIRESVSVIDLGASSRGSVATYKVRIEEYTYDYDMLNVVMEKNVTAPTSLQISYTPFHAYLLYIDDRPALLIADEYILDSTPSVSISYSTIYELFSMTVTRLDNIPSPLVLSINGRDVFLLDPSNKNYELHNRRTGFISVTVRDVYGRIVKSTKFRVIHIYESPLFILGTLSAGTSISVFVYAIKRRERKEVEELRMVFYKLPEVERKTFNEYVVEESISRRTAAEKVSPSLQVLLGDLYKRRPLLGAVNEMVSSVKDLLTKKGRTYGLYSRYVPELDDTITIVGSKKNLKKDFYIHVISELLKKFGGSITFGDILNDIIDVDSVITVGDKMLLVTYATTSNFRDAIDRALTSFAKIRRFKLPFTLIGLAIVTEPRYVKAINDIIDKILDQDDETASKILKDMTVYTHHIRTASKEAWLSKYIIVAVPITRIAPLLAFTKTGAIRLCNKYYRILY